MTREEQAKLWARRIAVWKASGLSRRAYCERESLSYDAHRRWSYRLRAGDGQAELLPVARFVPIAIGAQTGKPKSVLSVQREPASDPIEIRLRGGRTLMLGAQFDEAAVARVVRLLETL
jgi:hypothetical protein